MTLKKYRKSWLYNKVYMPIAHSFSVLVFRFLFEVKRVRELP